MQTGTDMGVNESRPRAWGAGRVRGLLLLNAALLMALAAVTFGSSAGAQARGRGEYTMVSGGIALNDSGAVYIVDTANQELIAMVYNPNTKVLDGIGYRNLAADSATVLRGGNRPSN